MPGLHHTKTSWCTYISSPDETLPTALVAISFLPFLVLTIFPRAISTPSAAAAPRKCKRNNSAIQSTLLLLRSPAILCLLFKTLSVPFNRFSKPNLQHYFFKLIYKYCFKYFANNKARENAKHVTRLKKSVVPEMSIGWCVVF